MLCHLLTSWIISAQRSFWRSFSFFFSFSSHLCILACLYCHIFFLMPALLCSGIFPSLCILVPLFLFYICLYFCFPLSLLYMFIFFMPALLCSGIFSSLRIFVLLFYAFFFSHVLMHSCFNMCLCILVFFFICAWFLFSYVPYVPYVLMHSCFFFHMCFSSVLFAYLHCYVQ